MGLVIDYADHVIREYLRDIDKFFKIFLQGLGKAIFEQKEVENLVDTLLLNGWLEKSIKSATIMF